MTGARPAAVLGLAAATLVLATACGAPADGPPAPTSRVFVLGPAPLPAAVPEDRAPSLRTAFDPAGVGWIAGLRAEADPGIAVTDAGVTLDVEVDVVRVSGDAPAFALPDGFAVSIAGALDALPAGWRGLHVTARALADGAVAARGAVRVTAEVLGPEADDRVVAVWRVPVAIGPSARVVTAPDGSRRVSTRLADVLPAPGTIHAIVPRTSGRASTVRVVDRGSGVVACALVRPAPGAPLGAWNDARGIAVARDGEAWLEFDLPPAADGGGVAVDVYLRPEGDAPLRYPEPREFGPRER